MMMPSTPENKNMDPAFTQQRAQAISYMVRCFRPGWEHAGIMKFLQELARTGITPEVAARAAVRAAQDPRATTPKAITFAKYQTEPKPTQPGTTPETGNRRCVECTTQHPTHTMTRTEHGWTCQQCTEEP